MIDLYQTSLPADRRSASLAPALSISDSESRLGWRYLRRQMLSAIPLLISDLVAISMVAGIAILCSFTGWMTLPAAPLVLWAYLTVTGILALCILGMYPNLGLHPAVEIKRIFVPATIITICLIATVNLEIQLAGQIVGLLVIWILMVLLLPMNRALSRLFASRYCHWAQQPIVILGGGPMGEAIFRSIDQDSKCGFRPIGIVDDPREQWTHEDVQHDMYVGTYPNLRKIVVQHDVYWCVVTDCQAFEQAVNLVDGDRPKIDPVELPHRLYLAETASFVPTMWDQVLTVNMVTYFKQTDRLLLPMPRLAKRSLDFLICLALGLIALPLSLVLTMAIKLSSRGPVFFRSRRVGRGNRVFRMFKFRSMYLNSESRLEAELKNCDRTRSEWEENKKLKTDPRITAVGRFLRRTSLDELPQVIDVLRGKMSVVGPRPMLVSEPDLYGDHYTLYCRMRPGITGLWQVSGRNNTSHERRVRLVAYYVQNWSPWLDIYILAKTLKVVFTGEGAY